MTPLILTFDEPTDNERLYVQSKPAKLLGAKTLIVDGESFRFLVYQYSDDIVVFHGFDYDRKWQIDFRYNAAAIKATYDGDALWLALENEVRHRRRM